MKNQKKSKKSDAILEIKSGEFWEIRCKCCEPVCKHMVTRTLFFPNKE